MAFNDLLLLELPNDFPTIDYAGFMSAARAVLLSNNTDAWKEFAGASNLIGWRFRASFEDMDIYIKSWQQCGADASFEELYLRERALYGMFSCGVSCIESACYASYALASHSAVLGVTFGEPEQRRCNPSQLKNALGSNSRAQPLVSALANLTSSGEWSLWVNLRNRMTHRSNLPRIIQGAVGSVPPSARALQFAATSSTPAFEADEGHLRALFSWLATSLSQVLSGGKHLAIGP